MSTAPSQAHQGQHISPGLGIALPLVQRCWRVCWGPQPWSTAFADRKALEDLPHPMSTGQA